MMAVQISVFLENKSGRLAEVTHALAGAEVTDGGLGTATVPERACLHGRRMRREVS